MYLRARKGVCLLPQEPPLSGASLSGTTPAIHETLSDDRAGARPGGAPPIGSTCLLKAYTLSGGGG
jgi:hypothetical protein